ncbi:hypothetical protein HN011_002845 [Eciton burchellii]|nr:hypothetical protein HN011_002845 [Eciton burchellii]
MDDFSIGVYLRTSGMIAESRGDVSHRFNVQAGNKRSNCSAAIARGGRYRPDSSQRGGHFMIITVVGSRCTADRFRGFPPESRDGKSVYDMDHESRGGVQISAHDFGTSITGRVGRRRSPIDSPRYFHEGLGQGSEERVRARRIGC